LRIRRSRKPTNINAACRSAVFAGTNRKSRLDLRVVEFIQRQEIAVHSFCPQPGAGSGARPFGPKECAQEIEITPEMIKAGVDAHAGYNPEFDDIADVVADIWLAMEASKLQKTD
jgi:hypothetical protein